MVKIIMIHQTAVMMKLAVISLDFNLQIIIIIIMNLLIFVSLTRRETATIEILKVSAITVATVGLITKALKVAAVMKKKNANFDQTLTMTVYWSFEIALEEQQEHSKANYHFHENLAAMIISFAIVVFIYQYF